MIDISELLMTERYEYMVFLIDFVLVTIMLTAIGRMTSLIANVNSIHELAHMDNYAYGISFAGAILSLAIVMTGAVSGGETITLAYEAMIVTAYGIIGIMLMALSRHFLDKISLPNISIRDEIKKGNMTAAVVDVANMLATAMIVRAVMIWVKTEAFTGLILVLIGFVISQLIMVLVTRYRLFVFAKRHDGKNLQQQFQDGNLAIAMRYMGHKIGVALAVTAATGIAEFDPDHPYQAVFLWAAVSLAMTILLSLISIAARHVILRGINVVEEVDRQRNIGIGLIEAVIYIVNGIILVALLAVNTQ